MKISLNFVSSFVFVLLLVSCTNTLQNEDSTALTFRGMLSVVAESELDRRVVKASAGGAELTIIRTASPMDDVRETKGSILSSMEGCNFFLNGYQYSASESWVDVKGRVSPSSFFYNQKVGFYDGIGLFDGSMIFRSGPSKRMAFFGMGPVDDAYADDLPFELVSSVTKAGAPEFSVRCSMDLESQLDLVECATVDVSGGGQDGVELSFSHALSGIRFVFNDFGADALVQKMTLDGFFYEGIRRVGEGWTLPDDSDLGAFDYALDVMAPSSGELALFDGQPLFVIPQEMGSSSFIGLYIDVCGEDVIFECPLEGLVFEPGKIYTFNFSVEPGDALYNVLTVDVVSGSGESLGSSLGSYFPLVPNVLTKAGASMVPAHLADVENVGAVVYSYKLFSSGLKRAVPWELQSYSIFAEDDITGEQTLVTVDSLDEMGVTVLTDSGPGNPYGDPFCFISNGDVDDGGGGAEMFSIGSYPLSGTKAGSFPSLYDSSLFFVNIRNSDGDEGRFLVFVSSSGSGDDGGIK